MPSHKRVKLDLSGTEAMAQLFQAYNSWHLEDKVVEKWMEWIHDAVNKGTHRPTPFPMTDKEREDGMLSIEIILGWSIGRISFAILSPMLLSLVIGLWLNSKNWTDNGTIQTAWGVASYIATAGACKLCSWVLTGIFTDCLSHLVLGALLGVISSISDK